MMAPMAMVTCNRCGLAFETAARTNTRCWRCRHVVNIGRTPTGIELAPVRSDDPSEQVAEPGLVSPLVVGLALAGGGLWCLWHGWPLPGADMDSERIRRSRLRWGVDGAVLLVVGAGLVVAATRP
jgi:hypothetical protein